MASMMAVTDTHRLLWYADPRAHRKLGREALAHFQRVDRREAAVYVPALVLAEVGELAHLIPERGDRLIAATVVALDVPLITRDPEIAACANVALLW